MGTSSTNYPVLSQLPVAGSYRPQEESILIVFILMIFDKWM